MANQHTQPSISWIKYRANTEVIARMADNSYSLVTVSVRLEYRPNGPSISEAIAKIAGASRTALREALDEDPTNLSTHYTEGIDARSCSGIYEDGCLVFDDAQAIVAKIQELVGESIKINMQEYHVGFPVSISTKGFKGQVKDQGEYTASIDIYYQGKESSSEAIDRMAETHMSAFRDTCSSGSQSMESIRALSPMAGVVMIDCEGIIAFKMQIQVHTSKQTKPTVSSKNRPNRPVILALGLLFAGVGTYLAWRSM